MKNVLNTGIAPIDRLLAGNIKELKFTEHKNIVRIDALAERLVAMPAIRYLDLNGLESSLKSKEDICLDLLEVNFKIYELVHKREISNFSLELVLDACESAFRYKDNIILMKGHVMLEELLILIEDLPQTEMNVYFDDLLSIREVIFRRELF